MKATPAYLRKSKISGLKGKIKYTRKSRQIYNGPVTPDDEADVLKSALRNICAENQSEISKNVLGNFQEKHVAGMNTKHSNVSYEHK